MEKTSLKSITLLNLALLCFLLILLNYNENDKNVNRFHSIEPVYSQSTFTQSDIEYKYFLFIQKKEGDNSSESTIKIEKIPMTNPPEDSSDGGVISVQELRQEDQLYYN